MSNQDFVESCEKLVRKAKRMIKQISSTTEQVSDMVAKQLSVLHKELDKVTDSEYFELLDLTLRKEIKYLKSTLLSFIPDFIRTEKT